VRRAARAAAAEHEADARRLGGGLRLGLRLGLDLGLGLAQPGGGQRQRGRGALRPRAQNSVSTALSKR